MICTPTDSLWRPEDYAVAVSTESALYIDQSLACYDTALLWSRLPVFQWIGDYLKASDWLPIEAGRSHVNRSTGCSRLERPASSLTLKAEAFTQPENCKLGLQRGSPQVISYAVAKTIIIAELTQPCPCKHAFKDVLYPASR